METFGALLFLIGLLFCISIIGLPVGIPLVIAGMVFFQAGGGGKTKVKVSAATSASSAASATGNVVNVINNIPDDYLSYGGSSHRSELVEIIHAERRQAARNEIAARNESIDSDVRRHLIEMAEGESRFVGDFLVRKSRGGWVIQKGWKHVRHSLVWDAGKYLTALIIADREKV